MRTPQRPRPAASGWRVAPPLGGATLHPRYGADAEVSVKETVSLAPEPRVTL
jgi:hypothetical protein